MDNDISKPDSGSPAHWSGLKEAGTLTGMRLLGLLHKVFGRWLYSVLMVPVSLYFVLFRPLQRDASLKYLKNLHAFAPHFFVRPPHYGHVLIHFRAFAEVILDKILAWSVEIKESEFKLTSPEIIDRLMQDQRGQLIIGTHFGNLEYCRGFMQRYKNKVINILVYDKHSGNFVKMMQKQNSASRINVFQVDEFNIATTLILQNKIAAGEWVFIAGDRIPLSGNQHTVAVKFLGRPTAFPSGPYLLAKALGCPVKFMFAYRHKAVHNRIIFDVVEVTDKVELSRKSRQEDIQRYAQQLADNLQEHCHAAPYQWFNFYDFWQTDSNKLSHLSKSNGEN